MTGEIPETDQTFGDISDEMQWEWDRELDVLWEFINEKDLYAEATIFARKAADAEKAELAKTCGHDDTVEIDEGKAWECRVCGTRFSATDIREGRA